MGSLKRFLYLPALILMSVSALWSNGQEDVSEEEASAKDIVEIFWHMTEYESWLHGTMKPLFEEDNPGIELKISFVNDPDNETVLQTRLAADMLPDIFAVIGGPAVIALQEDKLLDISQFPAVAENLDKYPDNLFSFSRMVREKNGLSPSGVYGFPTFKVMTGLFYDKNKFEENGLNPPDTYEDFWALMEDIKNSGVYRNSMAWGNHRWLVFNNFWQVATALAGPGVSEDLISGEMQFNSPEMVDVWEYYSRLAKEGYIDKNYKSKEWGQLESDFANLTDGVILQGPWLFNSYPKINPDVELGVVPFPTKDGTKKHWVGFVGDRNWWVSKKPTTSTEAQIKVVEWMTSADFAMHMITDVNLLPFYEQDYSSVDSPVVSEMEAQGYPVAPQANNQLDVIIPAGNQGFYSYVWERLPLLTDGEMNPAEFGTLVEDYYGQFR